LEERDGWQILLDHHREGFYLILRMLDNLTFLLFIIH
jgi:hypothetical protein